MYFFIPLAFSLSDLSSKLPTEGPQIGGYKIALNVAITKVLLRKAFSYSVSVNTYSWTQNFSELLNLNTEDSNGWQIDFNFDHFTFACMPQQPWAEACLIMHHWHVLMVVMEFASNAADPQKFYQHQSHK